MKQERKTGNKTMPGKDRRKTAVIVGAGDITAQGLESLRVRRRATGEGSLPDTGPVCMLIAADGGLRYLKSFGLEPDVIIGDFDSLGYVPEKETVSDDASGKEAETGIPEILCLPIEKDDTDMAAACRIAWERGCRVLRIYGGSGDRPDHFLANLQLAAAYSRAGADVRLIAPTFTVYAVTDGAVELESEPGVTFSVFCHGDSAEGVTIEGEAKYLLEDAQLTNTRALGVSNLMTGSSTRISVEKGTLLVFLYYAAVC